MREEISNSKNLFYWLFVGLLLGIVLYWASSPICNWDKVAYTACVLEMDGEKEIHQKTYNKINEIYDSSDNFYTKRMKDDEKGFIEQLSFYRMRVLYVFTSWVFYKLGVDILMATYVPSVLFSFLSIALVYYILNKNIRNIWIAGGLSLLLIHLFKEIIRITTPDAMSLFFILLGVYYYYKSRNKIGGGKEMLIFNILMIVSLFVRTDNVIFWGVLLGVSFVLDTIRARNINRINFFLFLSQTVVLIGISLGINRYFEYLGLRTLLYHTFVELQIYPESQPPHLTFGNYMGLLLKEKISLFSILIQLLFFLSGFWILRKEVLGKYIEEYSMILTIFFVIIIKFILFPVVWDRFTVVYKVLALLVYTYAYSKREVYRL